jgi:hypothetical protein
MAGRPILEKVLEAASQAKHTSSDPAGYRACIEISEEIITLTKNPPLDENQYFRHLLAQGYVMRGAAQFGP